MAAQKTEAERVRQEAMARFAEDARLAALTAQARRARTLAYKRELDATMAQRQALFEQQLVLCYLHTLVPSPQAVSYDVCCATPLSWHKRAPSRLMSWHKRQRLVLPRRRSNRRQKWPGRPCSVRRRCFGTTCPGGPFGTRRSGG